MTSEPADLASTAADSLRLPRMHQPTQGDDMNADQKCAPDCDERVTRYAEAMMAVPGVPAGAHFTGMFHDGRGERVAYLGDAGTIFADYASAAMAVADDEQDELRAEVERLRSQRDAANSRTLRMWERAKAAERALADEQAKVAKVRHLHRPQPSAWKDDYPDLQDLCYECGEYTPCETLRALAGPELETTEESTR